MKILLISLVAYLGGGLLTTAAIQLWLTRKSSFLRLTWRDARDIIVLWPFVYMLLTSKLVLDWWERLMYGPPWKELQAERKEESERWQSEES